MPQNDAVIVGYNRSKGRARVAMVNKMNERILKLAKQGRL